MAKADPSKIAIPKINRASLNVPIIGDTPLICHRFEEKARKAIRDKVTSEVVGRKKPKTPRKPEEEWLATLYKHPDGGWGFPSTAFKSACVDAARLIDGITMTAVRQMFYIKHELVKIVGEPAMREDMVRVGGKGPGTGSADIRWRGYFEEWSAVLEVEFLRDHITQDEIVNLINHAGATVGVGEWRLQKGGNFGLFRVAAEGV
jgi:hypothetical protein